MKKTIADVIFEEGIEQGELTKARKAILRFLKARFGEVGEGIADRIGKIDSIEKLDTLIDLAATCESLEGFEKGM